MRKKVVMMSLAFFSLIVRLYTGINITIDLTQPPSDQFLNTDYYLHDDRQELESIAKKLGIITDYPAYLNRDLTAICHNPKFKYQSDDGKVYTVLCAAYYDYSTLRPEVRLYELDSGTFQLLKKIKWTTGLFMASWGGALPGVIINSMAVSEEGVLAAALYSHASIHYLSRSLHTWGCLQKNESSIFFKQEWIWGRVTSMTLNGNDLCYTIFQENSSQRNEKSVHGLRHLRYSRNDYLNNFSYEEQNLGECYTHGPIAEIWYEDSGTTCVIPGDDSTSFLFSLKNNNHRVRINHEHNESRLLPCMKFFSHQSDNGSIDWRIYYPDYIKEFSIQELLVGINFYMVNKYRYQHVLIHKDFRPYLERFLQKIRIYEADFSAGRRE